jgi:hypothetical protein
MANKSFAASIVGDAASASYFIADILHASTKFSTTGRSLDGAILRKGGAGAPAFSPDFPGIVEQARRIVRVSAQFPSPLRVIFSGMR